MNLTVVLTEDEVRDFLNWRHKRNKAAKTPHFKTERENQNILLWITDKRIKNCLLNAKIQTVGQIIGKGRDLMRYRNFGLKSFQMLTHILKDHGIVLADRSDKTDPVFQFKDELEV